MVLVILVYYVSFWDQETEFRQSHVVVLCSLVMVFKKGSSLVNTIEMKLVKLIHMAKMVGDFLSLFCTLGLLSGSGDGVELITRGLFLMVTDGTNGDGVCGEDADDCDVHGEGG